MNERNTKNMADSAAGDFNDDDCVSEVRLLQFIEGNVSEVERVEIQKHLNECALCAEIVGAVYYNNAHPFTEEDEREAQKYIKRTPEEQVARLLGPVIHEEEDVLADSVEPRPKISWWQRPIVWQPAFAAFAILLLIGGQQGVHYYQTDYQIQQAAALLKQRQHLAFTEVRFSGGYTPDLGLELGERETYLDSARATIEKAVAKGADALAAQQLLLQVLTFNRDYAGADSLVQRLSPQAEKNPALANDLGVYYFKRENWSTARHYFEAAVRQNAKYPEARFNLALTQARLGEKAAALANLAEVLALEKNEGWKAAARELQNSLQPDKEE